MVGTAIGIGVSLVGSAISADAAQSAADTQANAANNATALQKSMFDTATQLEQPWVTAGNQALQTLQQGFTTKDYQQSPGYQFGLQQAEGALTNQNSARGMTLSGAQIQGSQQLATNLANQDFQTAYNNWASREGGINQTGQAAASKTASAATAYGTQAGSNIIGAGNAQAAGQVGTANAINSGLGSLAQSLGNAYTQNQQNTLNNAFNPNTGGYGMSTPTDTGGGSVAPTESTGMIFQ